jgi:hypothetical protein
LPPVTLPVLLELPPVPDVTSPVVELVASPVVPDVDIAEALPLSPVVPAFAGPVGSIELESPVPPLVAVDIGSPLRPDVPVEVPVAAADPPAPPAPAVVAPVVDDLPDVAVDDEVGSTVTAPLLPVSPESPDVALDVTSAGPELPVLPVRPELPVVALALMIALNTPDDGGVPVTPFAVFIAAPVLPDTPDPPLVPDVAVPLDVAPPVAPEDPEFPDVALVVLDELPDEEPEFPPVTAPVLDECPPLPELTVPAVVAPPLPVAPDVASVLAGPEDPVSADAGVASAIVRPTPPTASAPASTNRLRSLGFFSSGGPVSDGYISHLSNP